MNLAALWAATALALLAGCSTSAESRTEVCVWRPVAAIEGTGSMIVVQDCRPVEREDQPA